MSDLVREPCDYCEAGWCEGRPDPTPDGPHYPSFRCTMCDGHGWVEIERAPVTFDDLDDGEDADPYSAFAYRGGNP